MGDQVDEENSCRRNASPVSAVVANALRSCKGLAGTARRTNEENIADARRTQFRRHSPARQQVVCLAAGISPREGDEGPLSIYSAAHDSRHWDFGPPPAFALASLGSGIYFLPSQTRA